VSESSRFRLFFTESHWSLLRRYGRLLLPGVLLGAKKLIISDFSIPDAMLDGRVRHFCWLSGVDRKSERSMGSTIGTDDGHERTPVPLGLHVYQNEAL
jgi:hypothetical protein